MTKKQTDEQVGAVQEMTRGHSLRVHADAEQGTPSAATEGELTKVEEEPNGHEFEWLKAMNRDSRIRGS